MIKIYKGYEIDGSETSFNVFYNNDITTLEMFNYIINLPLWDKECKLYVYYATGIINITKGWILKKTFKQNKYEHTYLTFKEIDKLKELFSESIKKNSHIEIHFPCKSPFLLEESLRNAMKYYTNTRPGGKKEYLGMNNPVGSLYRNDYENNVKIFINSKLVCESPDGMILNKDSLETFIGKETNCLNLSCGPGFYYEFAAWIMNGIAKEFPEAGIEGGLDCAGNFSDGCTYANTLYSHEKIELPWKKVSYALDMLTKEFSTLVGAHSTWAEDRPIENYPEDYLRMTNSLEYIKSKFEDNNEFIKYLDKILEKDNAIKISEYQELCDKLFDSNLNDMELVSATSIELLFNSTVKKNYKNKYEKQYGDYQKIFHLACSRKNGIKSCELYLKKEYYTEALEKLDQIQKKE